MVIVTENIFDGSQTGVTTLQQSQEYRGCSLDRKKLGLTPPPIILVDIPSNKEIEDIVPCDILIFRVDLLPLCGAYRVLPSWKIL